MSFALMFILNCLGFVSKCENINNKILRLHILANSNSRDDQLLKLKVRDSILNFSEDLLMCAKNKEEAKQIVMKNFELLKSVAENEIKKHGYSYPVKVELKKAYFPTKQYDNVTLPAGNYEALRILIGDAKGQNWWCVMFPALCLGAAAAGAKIEDVLDTKETIIVKNISKYDFKFKFVECFYGLKSWLK